MIQIQVLLVFMIIAAAIAIGTSDLLGAVVSIGAVGLGLAIVFLLLQSPDLAILQLVVEILSLVILIRAVGIKDTVNVRERRFIATSISVILMGLFLVFASLAILEIPKFGNPAMKLSFLYLKDGFRQTGVPNIVSAIMLDYRSFDMLAQIVIAFTAAIGVVVIARKKIYVNKDKK
ncbi:MAG: DUF4040 domain-containing protein [Elusimicrobia bacterium]|nr:DUF4040 domain-containing protein [Elusimicrobiota bacterium]MBU2614413.1 DUF4040 domain-containing protein [Elusimicrobiota bacterium]